MHPLEIIRRSSGHQMPRLGLWANHLFQSVRPRQIRSEIVPGVFADLDLDDDTANNIFYLGLRYERPTLAILHSWAAKNSAYFFDIGANFGFFSLALTQRHGDLLALALEPHPQTFKRLQTIAEGNHISRLKCLQIAASDQRAELPFICDEQNSGASWIHPHIAPGEKSIRVEASPLDEIIAEHGFTDRPAFAKIDVEGHEMSVLKGMTETLRRGQLTGICIEMNRENLARTGATPEEIRSFLAAYDYEPMVTAEIERAHQSGFTDNWFFERVRG